MKIFNSDSPSSKSWSITLVIDEKFHCPALVAVDSVTGGYITNLITFFSYGDVTTCGQVVEKFDKEGYDPYQHNNEFDDDGSLRCS